jgi:hypothetical protein
MEKGKPRAEIGLVLRTLDALGIPLTTVEDGPAKEAGGAPIVNIDSIVAAARGERK